MSTQLSRWITIAHLGMTQAGRQYSAGNLLHMVERMNREDVRVGDVGVAARARLCEHRVQVQIHWFGDPPKGVYVAPVGTGSHNEYGEVQPDYVLERLKLTSVTTFPEADLL